VSPPRWNASKSSYVEGERHAAQVLVVLAFGALTHEIEHRRLDLDALHHESDAAVGGTPEGLELAAALIAAAGERRSVLAERLPYGTPNDWSRSAQGRWSAPAPDGGDLRRRCACVARPNAAARGKQPTRESRR
jgi:hypothetical protein